MKVGVKSNFGRLATIFQICSMDADILSYRNTKFSNLSPEGWSALKSLKKRKNIVIKAANKGGAVFVWRADLYRKEAVRYCTSKTNKEIKSCKKLKESKIDFKRE